MTSIAPPNNQIPARTQTIAIVANNSLGILQFRSRLISELITANYKVLCICFDDHHINKLVALGADVSVLSADTQSLDLWSNLSLPSRIRTLYRRHGVDLAVHFTIKPIIFGTMAARVHGIPCISVVAGLGRFVDLPSGLKRRIIHRLYGTASSSSNETWFLNDSDRAFFASRKWLGRGGSRVLPSEGVDITKYAYHPPNSASKHSLRILFTGRLLKSKGLADFIAAVELLRSRGHDIDAIIVGFVMPNDPDSITAATLQQWVEDGVASYLGSTDDIRPHLVDCDIVVLPTYYREGANRTILEALSMGRPVLTCKNQVGASELVQHLVSGYHVPIKNPEAIAVALEHFIDLTTSERTAMSEAARQYVIEHHDEADIVPIYLDTVHRLLSDGSPRKRDALISRRISREA